MRSSALSGSEISQYTARKKRPPVKRLSMPMGSTGKSCRSLAYVLSVAKAVSIALISLRPPPYGAVTSRRRGMGRQ